MTWDSFRCRVRQRRFSLSASDSLSVFVFVLYFRSGGDLSDAPPGCGENKVTHTWPHLPGFSAKRSELSLVFPTGLAFFFFSLSEEHFCGGMTRVVLQLARHAEPTSDDFFIVSQITEGWGKKRKCQAYFSITGKEFWVRLVVSCERERERDTKACETNRNASAFDCNELVCPLPSPVFLPDEVSAAAARPWRSRVAMKVSCESILDPPTPRFIVAL